jgi:hypothetical protein
MYRFLKMSRPPSSYFATMMCPRAKDCKLPHCLFSHQPIKRSASSSSSSFDQEPTSKRNKQNDAPSAVSAILNAQREDGDLTRAMPKGLPGVGAPATLQQRMRYISLLAQNYKNNGHDTPNKAAVDAEYSIATTMGSSTYNNQMKILIRDTKRNKVHFGKPKTKQTESLTAEETYKAVKKLVHSLEKLEREGYITEIPTIEEGEHVDLNTKKCDRCGDPFAIDSIMNKTTCRFHERKKRIENNDKYWECCSQVVGESQGCKMNIHHVFKGKSGYELHSLIPFRQTPKALLSEDKTKIFGLDCEMGYTSKGMEMIRLTIMDFFSGKSLFDEIVKPSGKILDLNTTWSGVSEIPEAAMTLDETMEVVLGNLINSDTIIVGHGLENDLNSMRLIHHNVVDTAILYPKSLTRKYALKDLAFQFLDRKIQTGQHSSEEDSLAAIDIVKVRITDK